MRGNIPCKYCGTSSNSDICANCRLKYPYISAFYKGLKPYRLALKKRDEETRIKNVLGTMSKTRRETIYIILGKSVVTGTKQNVLNEIILSEPFIETPLTKEEEKIILSLIKKGW